MTCEVEPQIPVGEMPDLMSKVIAGWIEVINTEMPVSLHDSDTWQQLVAKAAEGDRGDVENEAKRVKLVMGWLWDTVLQKMQGHADQRRIGPAWQQMRHQRTFTAADKVMRASRAAGLGRAAAIASHIRWAAACAEVAIEPWIAQGQPWSSFDSAYVGVGHGAARTACLVANDDERWLALDPVGLLTKLCAVE